MKPIDNFLNNITMYRLVVYALGIYVITGVLLAHFGRLFFEPSHMLASLGALVVSTYATNFAFSRYFKVPTNSESWLITALILFLILQPANSVAGILALVVAGIISSASKFILNWNGKHLFNPAALAAAVMSLTSFVPTTWWVGSSSLWPVTLLLGLAIVRKIRRFPMAIAFAATATVAQFVVLNMHNAPIGSGMKHALIASPLIFLGTIMLTEPATMPPRRREQIIFSVGVAVLYVFAWKVGPISIYPEVALLLGNVYAYVVSPKFRVRLELKEIRRISDRVYDYVFQPDVRFRFLPGQYLEWTLSDVPFDARGNRRTFTIASSPTEQDVHLGVKFYEPASTFKAVLADLQPGSSVYASQLAGNFTLDKNLNKKLVFIAGGIGITPFRSMAKYIIDTNQQRDIILLYAVSDSAELAYVNEFRAAEQHGLRFVPILTGNQNTSEGTRPVHVDAQLLAHYVPDYAERTFYISGPNNMVDDTKHYLRQLNVPRSRIRTDHFSGY